MEAKAQYNRKWNWTVLIMLLMSAMPIAAQQRALVGRVIKDDAQVRAGAGDSYYVVGHLKKGSIVNIKDRFFEWYKITPPSGVYSYVAKNRVNVSDDGKTGVITRDRTPVKAAGIDRRSKSYRRQVDLFKGDKVAIVEAEGDVYKIVPPRLTYVFVLVSSVKREALVPAPQKVIASTKIPALSRVVKTPKVTPLKIKTVTTASIKPQTTVTSVVKMPSNSGSVTAAPLQTVKAPIEVVAQQQSAPKTTTRIARGTPEIKPESGSVSEPAEELPTYRSPIPPKPAAAVKTVATGPTAEASARNMLARVPTSNNIESMVLLPAASSSVPLVSLSLEELNSTAKMAEQLPLERQPIAELLAAYEGHYQNTALSVTQRREVLMQIIRLRRNAALAMILQEISLVQQSLDKMPSAVNARSTVLPGQRVSYDAVGQLVASGVYDGTSLPRLYRLVSPSLRTVAYLRPNDTIDTTAMMGKILGVIGPSRYDPALKLRVLEARQIELLTPQKLKQSAAPGSPGVLVSGNR